MAQNIRLLIVDDEKMLRDLLLHHLDDYEGFEGVTAASSEEALKLLETENIDVCIVDARLPGMNGEQFILEAWMRGACKRFILHTGSLEMTLSERLMCIGMTEDDLFFKPVDYEAILDRITQLFKEIKI